MYKYKGYLIVSDLDGTLINSKQEVSMLNVNAIASFVEEGGLFAVATGRNDLNVQPYIKHLRISCPSILYNGAVIYDTNNSAFIKSIYLDKRLIIEPLKKILKKYNNLCMQIFTPGKMFIVSREKAIAIGDYCNDIEMIQTAGLEVATANAHPLLKEVTHITTVSNNEHAIYDLINRILPIYKGILDQDKKDTKTPMFKKLIT